MLLTADGPVWTGGGTTPPASTVQTGGNQPSVPLSGPGGTSIGDVARPAAIASAPPSSHADQPAPVRRDSLIRRIARIPATLFDLWRRGVAWFMALATDDDAVPRSHDAPGVEVAAVAGSPGAPARVWSDGTMAR